MSLAVAAGGIIYSVYMGYLKTQEVELGFGVLSLDSSVCTQEELTIYVRNLGKTGVMLDRIYVDGVPIDSVDYLEVNGPGSSDDKIEYGELAVIHVTPPGGFIPGKKYEIKVLTKENTQISFNIRSYNTSITGQIGLPWWNPEYNYSRRLNVTSTELLQLGYTVRFKLDTTGSEFMDDGDDLRIVFWNGTGYNELDRVNTTAFDSVSTTVWFPTVNTVLAGEYDDNYFVYYGNPSAVDAPSNRSKVYLWYDDFSTDTLANYDLGKWINSHGSSAMYTPPVYDAVNEWVYYDTGDNYASDLYPKNLVVDDALISVDFWIDQSYPVDATLALVSRLQNPGSSSTHYYYHFSHGSYTSPGGAYNSWTNGARNTMMYTPSGNVYWDFDNIHNLTYSTYDESHYLWYDTPTSSTPLASGSHSGYTGSGRWGYSPAQARGWVDNMLIRRYVDPEPVVLVYSVQTP